MMIAKSCSGSNGFVRYRCALTSKLRSYDFSPLSAVTKTMGIALWRSPASPYHRIHHASEQTHGTIGVRCRSSTGTSSRRSGMRGSSAKTNSGGPRSRDDASFTGTTWRRSMVLLTFWWKQRVWPERMAWKSGAACMQAHRRSVSRWRARLNRAEGKELRGSGFM